jgi:hypothetical protein
MAPTFWRNLLPPSSGQKREQSGEKWHMIHRRENWNWGCEKISGNHGSYKWLSYQLVKEKEA